MPTSTPVRTHVLRWLSVLGLVLGSLVVASHAAQADGPGAPFDCKVSTAFVSHDVPTQLKRLQYGSGSTTWENLGSPYQPAYAAIGFNPLDKFIYGVSSSDHLLRIDSAGVATDLGHLDGLQSEGGINVGTFDQPGRYWIGSSPSSTLYAVDIANVSVAPVALAGPLGVSDLTYLSGALWGFQPGVSTEGQTTPGRFVRVDPDTGTVDRFATTAIPSNTPAGGMWTYNNGTLGVASNTGDVYRVRVGFPNSNAPTFDLVGTGPNAGGTFSGDATSCDGPPADLAITKVGGGTVTQSATVTWEIRVHNNGPGTSSGYVVHDNVPAGMTNVHTIPVTQDACVVAPNNNVNCVGGPLGPGDERIITIQGTAPQAAGSRIDNTATVDGNDADPNLLNNTATAPGRVISPVAFCRGTALNALGLHLGEANPAELPCKDATDTELTVHTGAPSLLPALAHLVDAGVLAGATATGPGGAAGQATADVANVTVNLLNIIKIQAQALHSEAGAGFSGTCGLASLAGKSRVAAIAINGKGYIIGDAPVTIPLGIATIYINQTVVTPGSIIQRALFVDLPGTALDVVVAESKAGVGCA